MLMAPVSACSRSGFAANQVATGLALTIFGLGLSGLIGDGFVGSQVAPAPQLHIPVLTDLPFVGRSCSAQDALVYLSVVAGRRRLVVPLFARAAGLVLRAVGDNHASAHALGYPVLGCAASRCCSAAPAPGLRAPICRSPTRRYGSRA